MKAVAGSQWRVPAFAAVYLLWGGAFLAIRFVVQAIPPFLAAGIRYSLSAMILLLISLLVLRSPQPTFRQFFNCTVTGMVMFVCGYSAIYWAETRLASWLVAVLSSSGFLWTYVLESIVPGSERLRAATLLPLAGGLAGMGVLVAAPFKLGSPGSGAAAILVLTSVILWSGMTILLQRIDLPACHTQKAGLQLAGAAAGLLPLSYGLGEWKHLPESGHPLQAAPLVAMAYLVIGGSVVAFTAFHWLLARETPSMVATSTYVNPIVAMLAGIVLFHERYSERQLAGAVGVLLSVVLVWRTRLKTEQSRGMVLVERDAASR